MKVSYTTSSHPTQTTHPFFARVMWWGIQGDLLPQPESPGEKGGVGGSGVGVGQT